MWFLWPFFISRLIKSMKHAFRRSSPLGRTLDYKRTIYGQSHADYSEFLTDTSSFANTSGGDLVIGMDATKNGILTAITALSTPLDPEILRLEQVARGGLQPRIVNINF
jgi:predicted HTH transcriptional regulator